MAFHLAYIPKNEKYKNRRNIQLPTMTMIPTVTRAAAAAAAAATTLSNSFYLMSI